MAKATSLQDQLLNSGLANKNQSKKIRANKRKQNKSQQHNNTIVEDENKQAVLQVKQEKIERDKQLNLQQQQQAEQKAVIAQIKQLIEKNRQPQDNENGVVYHFTDQDKVKRLYVSETIKKQISLGQLAIVKLQQSYELVPLIIAEKIAQRDSHYVILINEKPSQETTSQTDDPYADYQIPDDLMW